jgi:hypothetical protein
MQISTPYNNDSSDDEWEETTSAPPLKETTSAPPLRSRPAAREWVRASLEKNFPTQLFDTLICKSKIGLGMKGLVTTENGSHVLYKTDARFEKNDVLKRHISVFPNNRIEFTADWYFMRLINYENPSSLLPFPPLHKLKGKTKQSMRAKMEEVHGGIIISKESLQSSTGIVLKRTSEVTDPITKVKNYRSFQLSSSQSRPVQYFLVLVPISDGVLSIKEAIRTVHFSVKSSNLKAKALRSGTKRKRTARQEKIQSFERVAEENRARKNLIENETEFIRLKNKQITDLFQLIREDLHSSNVDDFFHMSMMHHTQTKKKAMSFF